MEYTFETNKEDTVLYKLNLQPQKVLVTKNIERLEERCFEENTSLKEVIFENGGTDTISSYCFYNCKNLKNVTLPDNLEVIHNGSFMGCKSLKNIVLPENLRTITHRAFCGSGLESITLPESLKDVGRYAFAGCTSLSRVVFPKNMKVIEQFAFYNCPSLEEIILPEGLTVIQENAFYCKDAHKVKYKTVSLPSTLEELSPSAFTPGTTLLLSSSQLKKFSFLKDPLCKVNYKVTQYKSEDITIDDLINSKNLDEFGLSLKELNQVVLKNEER